MTAIYPDAPEGFVLCVVVEHVSDQLPIGQFVYVADVVWFSEDKELAVRIPHTNKICSAVNRDSLRLLNQADTKTVLSEPVIRELSIGQILNHYLHGDNSGLELTILRKFEQLQGKTDE
jgi:hypothetical protein